MLLIKLVSVYFWGHSRWLFSQFSENCDNQQKTLKKLFLTNFVKNNFSENCRQILGECLEYFRFAM